MVEKKRLITTLKTKSEDFGNTYIVTDTKTGNEFTIDQYPKRERGRGSANYIVSKRFGESFAKTMTLSGAKQRILDKVV